MSSLADQMTLKESVLMRVPFYFSLFISSWQQNLLKQVFQYRTINLADKLSKVSQPKQIQIHLLTKDNDQSLSIPFTSTNKEIKGLA